MIQLIIIVHIYHPHNSKIEVGISSNFLHSISTSIRIGVILEPFFIKKPWAIVHGFFEN